MLISPVAKWPKALGSGPRISQVRILPGLCYGLFEQWHDAAVCPKGLSALRQFGCVVQSGSDAPLTWERPVVRIHAYPLRSAQQCSKTSRRHLITSPKRWPGQVATFRALCRSVPPRLGDNRKIFILRVRTSYDGRAGIRFGRPAHTANVRLLKYGAGGFESPSRR